MKSNFFKKYLFLILIIVFSFIITALYVICGIEELIGIKFFYTCLAAFLALALNIYIHNDTAIDKLRTGFNKNKAKKSAVIINSLYKELKADCKLIFFSLFFLFFNYLFRIINIPGFKWPFSPPWTKLNFYYFFNLIILFSSFYALYDLFKTLLIISGRD